MRTPTSTSEPMRLLDESDSSLERSLLGAGRSYTSSALSVAACIAAAGASAVSSATGSATVDPTECWAGAIAGAAGWFKA